MRHHSPELVTKIETWLQHNPAALKFLKVYGEYVEVIDDLVDEPSNIARVEKLTKIALMLFSSDYWQAHKHELWLVEALTHLTYFDIVAWEQADEEWKRRDARALSHCAYNMLFSILILECGMEKAREISSLFREGAHKQHLNDPI